MEKRPSLFRSSPFVTVMGTLAIGLLWSPVFLAFFNVSGPVPQAAQAAANAEFLRADGTAQDANAAMFEAGLTAEDAVAHP